MGGKQCLGASYQWTPSEGLWIPCLDSSELFGNTKGTYTTLGRWYVVVY